MKKEIQVLQIVFEFEYEETNKIFHIPLYVGRRALIDDVEVYSDRMEARTYYNRTDPIIECVKFLNGNLTEMEKQRERIKNELLKILQLVKDTLMENAEKERDVKALRNFVDTSEGLWCIDHDPQDVSIEWIRKHAFQLKFSENDTHL